MKKVLVVDDSRSVRQQVGLALKQAGFEVVEAIDGVDGLEKISSEIGMVVCDVNMPRMNGLEFLESIRKQPAYVSVPVLMLTTEGQNALIQRAKKAGAKGWIVKPFKAAALIAAAKRFMG